MSEFHNPLYGVYTDLACDLFPALCEAWNFSPFLDDRVSYKTFIGSLVFESVADHIRQKQKHEDAVPLHSHIKHSLENSFENFTWVTSEEMLKTYSKDLDLRLNFLSAEIQRRGLSNEAQIIMEHDEMKVNGNRRKGYNITPIQFQQLSDRNDLFIKKVHELRRLINSKHATNSDAIRYYASLMEHAEVCSKKSDAKERIISAINLNDFENKNISLFLYFTARYCFEHNIDKITEESVQNLIALSGAISYSAYGRKFLSTRKPVLIMSQYISSAFKHSSEEITEYINLRICSLFLLKNVLPHMLNKIRFTYEDINQLFCDPDYNIYNIFSYYALPNFPDSDSIWDPKGKMISLLRKLIGILTVDPLSTN